MGCSCTAMRMNPHKQVVVKELNDAERAKVARALAHLEFGTYRDADSEDEVFRDFKKLLARREPAYISVAYPEDGSYLGPYLAYYWAVEIPFDTQDTGGWMREYGEGVETSADILRKAKRSRGEPAGSRDAETSALIEDLRRKIGGRRVLYAVDTIRDTRRGTPPEVQAEAKRLYDQLVADFHKFVLDNNYVVVSESRSKTSYKSITRAAERGLWDILVDIDMPNYYERGDGAHFMVRAPRRG